MVGQRWSLMGKLDEGRAFEEDYLKPCQLLQ
jgi:hypothetical protein